jgi:hypothetical protein
LQNFFVFSSITVNCLIADLYYVLSASFFRLLSNPFLLLHYSKITSLAS